MRTHGGFPILFLNEENEIRMNEAFPIALASVPFAIFTVRPSVLRMNTRRVTVADMTQLNYRHRRRPMFPFEDLSC